MQRRPYFSDATDIKQSVEMSECSVYNTEIQIGINVFVNCLARYLMHMC